MILREVTQLNTKREQKIQAIPKDAITQPKPSILLLEENSGIRELLVLVFITGGYRHVLTTPEQGAEVDLLVLDIDYRQAWEKAEQVKTAALVLLTCHKPTLFALPCHKPEQDTGNQPGVQLFQKPFHVHTLLAAAALALEHRTRTDSLDMSSLRERFHRLSHFDEGRRMSICSVFFTRRNKRDTFWTRNNP